MDPRRPLLVFLAGLVIAGCGSSSPSEPGGPSPAATAEASGAAATVTPEASDPVLVSVKGLAVTPTGELSWDAIPDATSYAVIGRSAEGDVWIWSGNTTSVAYGTPPADLPVPSPTAPSGPKPGVEYRWAVFAFGAANAVISSSDTGTFLCSPSCASTGTSP